MRKPFLLFTDMVTTLTAASGVALTAVAVGTDGPDGSRAGDDSVVMLAGESFLAGDPTLFDRGSDDSLADGPGEDQVYGRSDDDSVAGGPGRDEISGGDGDDLVDDGPHLDADDDEISGGTGNDVMDAFNDPAGADVVVCGSGGDLVYTDGTDEISDDCERTVRGPHPDRWDARFGVTR